MFFTFRANTIEKESDWTYNAGKMVGICSGIERERARERAREREREREREKVREKVRCNDVF